MEYTTQKESPCQAIVEVGDHEGTVREIEREQVEAKAVAPTNRRECEDLEEAYRNEWVTEVHT